MHTVIIKPQVEDYGWLRAFWYKGTSYASFLVNIISDKSYKGYALSDMYSGNWYKAYQYYGCSNLITVQLSNSITILENGLFSNCYNLKNINIPNGILEIKSIFLTFFLLYKKKVCNFAGKKQH